MQCTQGSTRESSLPTCLFGAVFFGGYPALFGGFEGKARGKPTMVQGPLKRDAPVWTTLKDLNPAKGGSFEFGKGHDGAYGLFIRQAPHQF